MVEFEDSGSLSLLDFIRLENYLSKEIGIKVDLVEKILLKKDRTQDLRRSGYIMKREFLNYIEDIIEAMEDALNFLERNEL